jgi:hypothetical protein
VSAGYDRHVDIGWWLASIVLAGCGSSRMDAATAYSSSCVDERTANEMQGTALQRNEQRYKTALASQQLTPITLTMRTWELPFDPRGRMSTTPVDKVEERDTVPVGPTRVRAIMWGERVANCQSGPPPEFVEKGGSIFRVKRMPRIMNARTVTVCTIASCTPQQPPFQCGGAQMAPEAVGYELPASATYAGAIEVAFEAESVELRGQLAKGTKPCPGETLPP